MYVAFINLIQLHLAFEKIDIIAFMKPIKGIGPGKTMYKGITENIVIGPGLLCISTSFWVLAAPKSWLNY